MRFQRGLVIAVFIGCSRAAVAAAQHPDRPVVTPVSPPAVSEAPAPPGTSPRLLPLWIARPRYPPIAQSARVHGVVVVEVEVGTDGQIVASTITRSLPLLDQAVLGALKETYFVCQSCGAATVHRTLQYEFTLVEDETVEPVFEVRAERIRVGVIAPVPIMMPQFVRR